jgi:hypothetical protein
MHSDTGMAVIIWVRWEAVGYGDNDSTVLIAKPLIEMAPLHNIGQPT